MDGLLGVAGIMKLIVIIDHSPIDVKCTSKITYECPVSNIARTSPMGKSSIIVG
jgi:hypothetical protein